MITSNEHHSGAQAVPEVLVAVAPGVAQAAPTGVARGYRGAERIARVPDT